MIAITPDHISKLIALEAKVDYYDPPSSGKDSFVVVEQNSPILVSAPHGARSYRNNKKEIWHEEDEFTAGMALILAELCSVSAIALYRRSDYNDPNYTADENIPYKQTVKRLLLQNCTRYVIDLHGAALYSPVLDPQQTIDLGLRQKKTSDPPSMEIDHVKKLEELLSSTEGVCNSLDFVVSRNKFPGEGNGTITSFASRQLIPDTDIHVQAIQIEMKPQVRVPHRFPTATLYKSCGHYQAEPESVMHLLQSLVDFIEYLKLA